MSLRTRLLLGLAVLVVAAVVSSGWLLLSVARLGLHGAMEVEARQAATILARGLTVGLDDEDQALSSPGARLLLQARARGLVERGDALEVVIIDRDRRPVVGEADGDVALAAALTPSVPLVVRRPPRLYVYAPLVGARGVRGAARLRLAGDDELGRALGSSWKVLIVLAAIDALLVLAFGALFIRRVIGPIDALASSARKVAAGQLDIAPLVLDGRDDELSRLAEAFARMTESLRAQRDHIEAQEKLATVGRLAAGVAHEVGNPLAAILGYADLLLADEPAAPSERRDMLERIRKETDRIRGIIVDLLDYSRPPAADPATSIPLRQLVEESLDLVRKQARFRDVIVDDKISMSLPNIAATSRHTQVLVNLFLNAADAMNGQGTLTLEAKELGDTLMGLFVRDTGPGVPDGDRERIFDPFYTTKEPGKGTGLGLAVSRSIARAAGGDLVVERRGSGGATFVLTLLKS